MAKWRRANCYGYAAKTNEWLLLSDGYEDIDSILSDNPNWYPVRKQDLVLGRKYVAYRYGSDDFHFMFRDEKGHWRHKPGTTRVQPISTKDVFADSWPNGSFSYTSKIYLFEVVEDK